MIVERKVRTIFKSITWRITATLTTITLVYIFTGKLDLAFEVGAFEVILKMIFYYLHERIWATIQAGLYLKNSFVILFTGLSGSGKTELSKSVYKYLQSKKLNIEFFNGERIRQLIPNIGFKVEHRKQHLKNIFDFVKILENNHTNVIVSMEAPFADSRQILRDNIKQYIEIYINTSLEYCEINDKKSLYKNARNGTIKDVVGIDISYEEPENPNMKIDLSTISISQAKNDIINYLKKNKYI